MIRHLFVVLTAVLIFISGAQAADSIGLVTGPKTGTYYAFGKDIAVAVSREHIDVDVKTSEGSIDNIKRINSSENAALGIVQSDVLGFLARAKNSDSLKIANSLRMVFPLYNEEVHVLARSNIKNFAGLQGKKIAIGEDGSGSMLTSINLLSMMSVVPGEVKKIPSAQGVVAVLKGELDAAVFVGGKPVRLFKNLEDLTLPENQKYASMLEQVHFLPLDNPKMLEEYKPAEITPADYHFVTQKVPTISVQAMLVSYDFSKSNNKKRCALLEKFVKALRDDLPALRERGHVKWKEVNLDADAGSWKKDSCASAEPARGSKATSAKSK